MTVHALRGVLNARSSRAVGQNPRQGDPKYIASQHCVHLFSIEAGTSSLSSHFKCAHRPRLSSTIPTGELKTAADPTLAGKVYGHRIS